MFIFLFPTAASLRVGCALHFLIFMCGKPRHQPACTVGKRNILKPGILEFKFYFGHLLVG